MLLILHIEFDRGVCLERGRLGVRMPTSKNLSSSDSYNTKSSATNVKVTCPRRWLEKWMSRVVIREACVSMVKIQAVLQPITDI